MLCNSVSSFFCINELIWSVICDNWQRRKTKIRHYLLQRCKRVLVNFIAENPGSFVCLERRLANRHIQFYIISFLLIHQVFLNKHIINNKRRSQYQLFKQNLYLPVVRSSGLKVCIVLKVDINETFCKICTNKSNIFPFYILFLLNIIKHMLTKKQNVCKHWSIVSNGYIYVQLYLYLKDVQIFFFHGVKILFWLWFFFCFHNIDPNTFRSTI